MKITIWINNELIWYKIFLDNYEVICNYEWDKELPQILIIENYLICYISIYNVLESYINLLLNELKIPLINKKWDFKWIYTKIKEIDCLLKRDIESEIVKIKDIRNWILHLENIEFDMSKKDDNVICNNFLYFDKDLLTNNHNDIINIINVIWKKFLNIYSSKFLNSTWMQYKNIFELNKFIGIMEDMQSEKWLKNKSLKLPNL